jgi:hypothetical protein
MAENKERPIFWRIHLKNYNICPRFLRARRTSSAPRRWSSSTRSGWPGTPRPRTTTIEPFSRQKNKESLFSHRVTPPLSRHFSWLVSSLSRTRLSRKHFFLCPLASFWPAEELWENKKAAIFSRYEINKEILRQSVCAFFCSRSDGWDNLLRNYRFFSST